jgi:hypothetical protein
LPEPGIGGGIPGNGFGQRQDRAREDDDHGEPSGLDAHRKRRLGRRRRAAARRCWSRPCRDASSMNGRLLDLEYELNDEELNDEELMDLRR